MRTIHRPWQLAVLGMVAAVVAGAGAATTSSWWGACQPQFPGVDGLVAAMPSFGCFSVTRDSGGGDAGNGYAVAVSYSGHENDPQDAVDAIYAEAEVFWKRFPYRVTEVHVDPTAAFGESATGPMTLSADQLQARFGPRPASLATGVFPEQPLGRMAVTLWTVSGVAGAAAVGAAAVQVRRSRRTSRRSTTGIGRAPNN
ncbi:hypothetical protein [Kitasatospora paracochleata]|uniref:hypothetical protein n=1 Tax=Kitasatospora paracochleata TaxID=58354 RepID=UPI0031D6760F